MKPENLRPLIVIVLCTTSPAILGWKRAFIGLAIMAVVWTFFPKRA